MKEKPHVNSWDKTLVKAFVLRIATQKDVHFQNFNGWIFGQNKEGLLLKAGFGKETTQVEKDLFTSLAREIFGEDLAIEFYRREKVFLV